MAAPPPPYWPPRAPPGAPWMPPPTARGQPPVVPGQPPIVPGFAPWGVGPPPKKDNTMLIVVVVAIVVVALMVALPMMLFVMVSGLEHGPGLPPNPATFVMQAGNWNAGTLTLSVVSVSGPAVDPSDLTYFVGGFNGTVYYSGAAGLNESASGASVGVVFQDNLDAGRVSAGDSVRLTVSPATFSGVHGGTLRVFVGGSAAATSTLP